MVIRPCGAQSRITTTMSTTSTDGDLILWSHSRETLEHVPIASDCSFGSIVGKTPTIADCVLSLRCAIVIHSIDPESRVTLEIADGVFFYMVRFGKDSNNGRFPPPPPVKVCVHMVP